jgi:hypothetical protein
MSAVNAALISFVPPLKLHSRLFTAVTVLTAGRGSMVEARSEAPQPVFNAGGRDRPISQQQSGWPG